MDPPLGFADVLCAAIQPDLVDWATGPNAPVVAAFLESEETSAKTKDCVRKALNKNRAKLDAAAAAAARGSDKPKTGDKGGKATKKGKAPGGGGGVRILLDVLGK